MIFSRFRNQEFLREELIFVGFGSNKNGLRGSFNCSRLTFFFNFEGGKVGEHLGLILWKDLAKIDDLKHSAPYLSRRLSKKCHKKFEVHLHYFINLK